MEEASQKTNKVKIIVDTNIVFSSILNSKGKVGKVLFHSKGHFKFYSTGVLKSELLKHRAKLLKLTNLSIADLDELELITTRRINFISEELIPKKHLLYSENLLEDIDPDDTTFVALTKHLKGKLWTGDKELYKGLKGKHFKDVVTTQELSDLLDELEQ